MKLTSEQLLVPLVVSFFMSGINTVFAHIERHEFLVLKFFIEWGLHWALAYPCLLFIVPLAKQWVQKILNKCAQSSG